MAQRNQDAPGANLSRIQGVTVWLTVPLVSRLLLAAVNGAYAPLAARDAPARPAKSRPGYPFVVTGAAPKGMTADGRCR